MKTHMLKSATNKLHKFTFVIYKFADALHKLCCFTWQHLAANRNHSMEGKTKTSTNLLIKTVFLWIHINCVPKNIPDIFDCNLKTNYQILMIFGTNIPDTTCHQMTIQFPPHPKYAFTLPREIRSSEICVKINRKREKNIPDIIDCNLNKD